MTRIAPIIKDYLYFSNPRKSELSASSAFYFGISISFFERIRDLLAAELNAGKNIFIGEFSLINRFQKIIRHQPDMERSLQNSLIGIL